ncbi:OmpH family outer membrane protein [Falsirhodobacter algicola]|uniref:OmpH family outer membrane protein n=1 Tax=Falsirhodobacter algicola TaxID=2692330 RepID=A0A8J8MRN6_9RHOB|nr:OmpH family outer membrane protein [Falsirhodobacter algicola]QUS35446.1 OmpH family outer membrane protein [Falsirhodobacter algicola]
MWKALALICAFLPGGLAAQEAATPPPRSSAILTIVPDRLFEETQAGKTAAARFEQRSRDLLTENRGIEADLTAEEQELTERRATTAPQDFHVLSEAFDKKVEKIREEQDAKSRALTRLRDADRKAFFQAAIPVLANLMEEEGALAILDRGSVFLSFDLIDVTDRAIAQIDTQLGDGASIYDDTPAP